MVNENYIRKLIDDKMRIDGRAFDEFRKVTIETGVISSAEGSARVRIGNSQVVVGVKMNVVEPFPDTPNEGVLIVDTEFLPLASPDFDAGPPSPAAVETARVVDRGIRECHAIDLEKLCIIEGEKVWSVNVDVSVLDHDGDLITAASLGALAALSTAKVPKYDAEAKKVIREPSVKLHMKDHPIEVTVAKISDSLIVDPSYEEEQAMDARITMAVTDAGNFCAMQKGGTGYFTIAELEQAADLIIQKSKELRRLLKQ